MSIIVYGYRRDDKGLLRIVEIHPYVSWSNSNAEALLTLLEVQRAIAKAKSSFKKEAGKYTRETEIGYGPPREEDGVVELRPLRYVSYGIDERYLATQLERLEEYMGRLAEAGAERVGWG